MIDDYVKNAKIETTVKFICSDPNKFTCDAAGPNECGITSDFSPFSVF